MNKLKYNNSHLFTVAFCISTLLLAGCTKVIVADETGKSSYATPSTVYVTRGDVEIAKEVKNRLFEDSIYQATDIRVSSMQGVVTLSGTVPSYAIAEKAVLIAKRTPGVRNVVSKLIVANY